MSIVKLRAGNFPVDGRSVSLQACHDRRVDWTGLRRALAAARIEAGHDSAPKFAKLLGRAKTTVYRVESHETQPDLDTIEMWLRHTSGEPVSLSLMRFDGSAQKNKMDEVARTSSDTAVGDTQPLERDKPLPGENVDDGPRAEASVIPSATADAALLEQFAFALIRAARARRRNGTIRSNDVRATSGGGGGATPSRSTAGSVRRVK